MTDCTQTKPSQDGFPTTPDHHDTEGPWGSQPDFKTPMPNVGMLFAKAQVDPSDYSQGWIPKFYK